MGVGGRGGTGGTGGTDLGNMCKNSKLRCVTSGTKVAQEVAQAAQRWHSPSLRL